MKSVNENYFKNDKDKSVKTIEEYIDKDEPILWHGKPNKKAFILASIFKSLPFALLWLLFDSFFIYTIIKHAGRAPLYMILIVLGFILLHLAPFWMWLSNLIKSIVEYKNIEYAFTNKRIIIKSGIIGIDFKNIFYSEMESVNLKVGIIDKLFKVGDIYINCKNKAIVLNDLSDPYFLTEKLQSIVIDIKTDIEFPNAFRPDENPGYNTKLKSQAVNELKAKQVEDKKKLK